MAVKSLWAVEVYDKVGSRAGWSVVAIYQYKDSAKNKVRAIEGDHRRWYPLVAPKIVHPPQWVVDAWLAAGNRIY